MALIRRNIKLCSGLIKCHVRHISTIPVISSSHVFPRLSVHNAMATSIGRYGRMAASSVLSNPERFFSTNRIAPALFGKTKDEPGVDKLIYKGALTNMVRAIKFFSLSTSIMSSGLLVALYMSFEGGALSYVACGFSGIMILTPLVLHWFTKGYITRMYYDFPVKTYTAYTFDFFLTDVRTDFTRGDVSMPTVTSAVSSFAIKGKPVLVDPRGFLNPNHYSHLMGYTDTEGNISVEDARRAYEEAAKESKT